MDKFQELADGVIGVLSDRGGFDSWWGDIDEEVLNEIIDAIADYLRDNAPIPYEVTPAGKAALRGES
jgi:hypothetical protein